ncbi:hypothetical protein [Amycolatopsis kentuckyensis]|uniref:hypothetical protein n=1 Tax=Amycolatopsis kentuckyensis TaxID=218823 RepID=UPI000A3C47B1|nr:hypothetical protein [Amycolatopsis kentuckyensis]
MSVATKLKRLAVLTSAATVAMTVVTATPASAEVIPFPVSFAVTGSTVVKKTGSTMNLGPGTLAGNLLVNDETGEVGLSADLSLPPSQANISLVSGLFKVKATVKVVPLGPATGTLVDATLTTHAKANMEISNIWVGLLAPVIPLPTVPGSCKTKTPIELNLVAKDIDIFSPITVSADYTIPEFTNCWVADLALGAMVSGPGNTINLTLTPNATS